MCSLADHPLAGAGPAYAQLLVTCVSPYAIPRCDVYVLCVHTYRWGPGQHSVACMQLYQSRDPDPLVRVLGEIPNEYPQPRV